MRGDAILGASLWTLLGCTPTLDPDPPVIAAEVEEATDEPPSQDAMRPTSTPLYIGWAEIPSPPSDEAQRHNGVGLKLHRSGDYARALAEFGAARAASPQYTWARYNRACALSRMSLWAAAATELEALLREDFPTFRRRYLDDPDLAAVRDSVHGRSIDRLLPRLSAAYVEALDRSAPAFTYHERPDWLNDETDRRPQTPYTALRIGVYDHVTARFVPMVPKVGDAYSGLLDRERGRAIVATGQLRRKDMWEVQPHGAAAVVFSLRDFGDRVLEARHVSPPSTVFYGFELWLGNDDALYGAQYNLHYSMVDEYFRWTASGHRSKLGWTDGNGEQSLDPPAEVPRGRPSLQVWELAQTFPRARTRAKLDRRVRTVGYEGTAASVQLEPGHHEEARIYASPDPMVFAVVSNTMRFSTDGGEEWTPTTRLRHVIDRVDMHNEVATRLAMAADYAHVAWAPDGTLFVDAPDGVRRYGPGSTKPIRDVPTGVRFGTPPFPEEGGV
jgi:hypothetical protein